MHFPEFFGAAPRIIVRDSLAEFLDAAMGSRVGHGSIDAVKLAEHAGLTASAYLMIRAPKAALYPDPRAARGDERRGRQHCELAGRRRRGRRLQGHQRTLRPA